MDETEKTVALASLERYDLDVVRCEPLTTSYNALFRVDTADGSRYALRISPERRVHRDGSDEAEAAWLDALHRDGVVTAPRFVRSRDGAAAVDVSSRRCALMTWVEGRRLADDPTPAGIGEMGALAARLHGHRATANDPSSVPSFDRVVYWALEVRFDELTPAQRSVVDPALARAEAAIDAVWSAAPIPPQLLHGDIGTSNVLVSRLSVGMVDFEDLVVGFPVLDLSISIAELRRHHGDPALVTAFREGYERERAWPEVDRATFEALVGARWLHQIDLGLNLRKPGLERYVEDLVNRIDALEPG